MGARDSYVLRVFYGRVAAYSSDECLCFLVKVTVYSFDEWPCILQTSGRVFFGRVAVFFQSCLHLT